MSKCENCIHEGMCRFLPSVAKNIECRFFKDKSLFVEFPCKVGQTIFFYTCVCDKTGEERFDILEGEVISFSMQKEGLWAYCRYKCGLTYWHIVDEGFGESVFLTKEEAEAKLKEIGE